MTEIGVSAAGWFVRGFTKLWNKICCMPIFASSAPADKDPFAIDAVVDMDTEYQSNLMEMKR